MSEVKLNPKKHKGYIICKRLNKILYIDKDAVPSEYGWLCKCERWTKEDKLYHRVMYMGKFE